MEKIWIWTILTLFLRSEIIEGNAPNIEVSHNMRVLKLPRETKVGSIIYRLKGHDFDIPDVLTFGVRGSGVHELLEVRSASFTEANVILRKRPTEVEYRFTVYVTDGIETTEDESTIFITDATEVLSPFLEYDPVIKLSENTVQNTTVGYVVARDKDKSNLPVQFEIHGSEKFSIRYVFGPRGTSKAEIKVIHTVDYERRNMYHLQILALNAWTNETVDTRNIAEVDIVVTVEDVQDTPPIFMDLPSVVRVSESLKPGNIVIRVHAEDGDFGDQRNISYSFVTDMPWVSYFTINSTSGDITLAQPMNELRRQYKAVTPLLLGVRAREIASSGAPPMDTTAEVALVLVNTENHPPKFASTRYEGTIEEGSPVLTAVRWEGATVCRVTDDDQGKNGTFRLYLEGDGGTFDVQPSSGMNQVDFAILVKNGAALDYESNDRKYLDFHVVARETQAVSPLSSTTEVRVKVLDVNDNIPQFKKLRYEASISENAEPGTFITKIEATDKDTGDFGKVRYTSINGPIAQNLMLNSETGVITLQTLEEMDRERIPEYTLIVEARDNLGRGNKNVVELLIRLMDANDNIPVFLQPRYDAVLNTDMRSFNQRLIVKAFDADEIGPNSNVTYEIISGNYQDKFQINPISGEITLKEPLADVTNQESHNLPPITLNVRAHDQGIPVQSSSVEVQVHNQEYLNRTIMFIIPLPAEEIFHRKYEIERSFNTLTGARVSIYSVRPYNGSQSSSVAHAWVAYPLNSIIDVFSMEDAISTIYGRQYILQDKSEIREVRQEDYDIVFWFLITIVIILLLLLLLLLMYCCCCYRGKVWRKEYMKASNKVGPVEHIVTIQEKGSAENKDGQRKEPWHEDEARVWKYSQISPNHRRGRMDNHRDYRHERVEKVYHERRLVSPDDRIRYTELPRDITGGQQVGNYYVVHRNIKNGQWKDGDRYRAYQFDESNKPKRTEILYIKSPIHDPEVHTLRYRGEADEEEIFRSVSQQESIRDRQEQRDSRSYDALHQPRKIVYRDESDPRDQQLKFSRYHRTNSDVYIPNVDGDMFSRPVQYSRTQAAENGNFIMPEEKGRSQIIHGEDSCWRDKFEVEQRFVKRFEENEKPQCNSGIQNTFHATEQQENIHQQLEPQDRITLVYGEYKQQPPDLNHSYQRINSYQMTSNDAMHWNEPSTNPNMTRREIIREYRYSNNKVDQCSQNNQSSTENQEDKPRISQDNETVYVENYSGQPKLEGNMQDTSINPILMQKEIIREYRYSNNEMDQCPKNKNSAKDEMNKTKIVKMDNENHSKHQTDESINQKSEPNPVSSNNLSNQPGTSREIQNSFMNTIQPQDSTSEMHIVKENHVTHQGNNINLHVEQKENNSNNFLVYREAPLITPGQTNHQEVPQ